MPSGFQQDNNQLSPGFYRVVITMSGEGVNATWTQYGDGELSQQGRVNPFNWDNYDTPPGSNNNGIALAAGNSRWQAIIDELTKVGDCQILDVEVNSGDATDANYDVDSIAFTVKYDRDAFVFPAYNAIQKAEADHGGFYGIDNGTNGTVTIDGVVYDRYWSASGEEYEIGSGDPTADAIKDLVFRGIARGWFEGNDPDFTHTKSMRVYQESTETDTQKQVSVNIPGTSDSYRYWEDISVSNLDGTTTTLVKSD